MFDYIIGYYVQFLKFIVEYKKRGFIRSKYDGGASRWPFDKDDWSENGARYF